jgi:hypothetical protein
VRLLLIGLIGLAVGCARVRVIAFDNVDRTVMLCGNAWAAEADFGRAARAACPQFPRLLRCGLRQVAARTVFDSDWSGATTVPVNRQCCVYQCG